MMDGRKLDQDPMQMPSWSIGMACVWIVYRAPRRIWRLDDAFYDESLNSIESFDVARTELQNALVVGDLSATGLLANGVRQPIPALEWEDMTLDYELRQDEGLVHRAHAASGNTYRDIRVSREPVLARWPATSQSSADILQFSQSPRRRGPQPLKRQEVAEAMRTFENKKELAEMKEEALAATFSASRETCRIARQIVLSELTGNNPDK